MPAKSDRARLGEERPGTKGGKEYILLCQSVKYKGDMKVNGPLCGGMVSLDFALQVGTPPLPLVLGALGLEMSF